MLEIERKFLIKKLPSLKNFKSSNIEQGYINYNPVIRIRKKDNEYFITQKSKGNLMREENEIKIDKEIYKILSSLVKNNVVKKVRYEIPLSKHLAELDIYQENLKNLCIVEVEFKSKKESEDFIIPDWFGLEVTKNSKYKNDNLSKCKNKEFLVK